MKSVALFIAIIVVLVTGRAESCWSDADCNGGCCTQTHEGDSVCKDLAKVNEVCDLEGQGLAHNVCGCGPGLVCEKIDLGIFGEVADAASPILEKHHYGWCEVANSVIG